MQPCAPARSLTPSNLIIVVAPRCRGYRYSAEDRHFRPDPASPERSPGSGYAMMQLTWPNVRNPVAPCGNGTAPAPIAGH